MSLSTYAQFETANDSSNNQKPYFQGPEVKKQKTPIKDRLLVGGGFDLRFGDITVIGLTPLVGYKVTDQLVTGGIFTYRYFKDNRPGFNYSTTTYGFSPFARYTIFRGLFAHVEYEMLYGEFRYNDDPRWVNSFFVGGGYGVPLGDNGFAGLYLLWNLTEDPNYRIYQNPVVRMSFGVGF